MEQTNEKYLVYMHVNKLNNKVYIGITSKLPHQRWGFNGRNYKMGHTAFYRALKKYPDWDNDWDHIILKQDLTKDEACDAEVELIAQYKSNCCRYQNPSYGYNMTDGGEGRTGSYGMKGESHPNYGKIGKLNPMSKGVYCVEDNRYFESVSMAAREYGLSSSQVSHRCKDQSTHADIDRHFLYEEDVCPELIARCLLQKRNHRIYCIDIERWFEDATEASVYAKVSVRNIRSSCQKLGKMAAGKDDNSGETLHWLYEKDVNDINIRNALDYKKYADRHMFRKVYCIETDEYYPSIAFASKKLGVSETSICSNCNRNYSYAGLHPVTGEQLHWIYAEDVSEENIQKALSIGEKSRFATRRNIHNSPTAVYCIELNMAFSSVEVPAKALGIAPKSIRKCLCGELDYAGRKAEDGSFLHWVYLKDCDFKDDVEIHTVCNIERFFKKIYCIELDKFFTTREAARELHIDRSYLFECLRGERETVGEHPTTKEKLHWKYVYNKSYVGQT